jgi:hypothetical protein
VRWVHERSACRTFERQIRSRVRATRVSLRAGGHIP